MAQELFSSYLVDLGMEDLSEVMEASSVSCTSETRQLKILSEESYTEVAVGWDFSELPNPENSGLLS